RSAVADMRTRLVRAFENRTSAEAVQTRDLILINLGMLQDPEVHIAEQWMAETLTVASDSYLHEITSRLPDLVADSPGEGRSKLRAFVVRGINLRQVRQGFEQSRQAAVQMAREDGLRQAQFNAQLRASMTYSAPNLYGPTIHNGPPPQARYSGYFN